MPQLWPPLLMAETESRENILKADLDHTLGVL
jgi:hypothetical protein